MKKIFFLILLLLSTIATAKLHHDPSQLTQFQKTGKCESCDFTDAVVNTKVQPPFDLWHANLSGATVEMKNNTLSDYTLVTAFKTNFSYQDYSKVSFVNAVLIDAVFVGADLTYTNFAGATVTDANFSNADLYGSQGINIKEVYSVCNAILPDGSRGHC